MRSTWSATSTATSSSRSLSAEAETLRHKNPPDRLLAVGFFRGKMQGFRKRSLTLRVSRRMIRPARAAGSLLKPHVIFETNAPPEFAARTRGIRAQRELPRLGITDLYCPLTASRGRAACDATAVPTLSHSARGTHLMAAYFRKAKVVPPRWGPLGHSICCS